MIKTVKYSNNVFQNLTISKVLIQINKKPLNYQRFPIKIQKTFPIKCGNAAFAVLKRERMRRRRKRKSQVNNGSSSRETKGKMSGMR